MAAFYLTSVFVGGISGILTFALMQMEGLRGYRGWRWIFVCFSMHYPAVDRTTELIRFRSFLAIITLLIAIASWFLILDFPDKASKKGFLTEDEARYIQHPIEKDRGDAEPDPLTLAKLRKHLMNLKLWLLYVSQICTNLYMLRWHC